MERFIIQGGKLLDGKLKISTSKNATLPIIASSVLCDNVVINDAPNFSDICTMSSILQELGVDVKNQDKNIIINSQGLHSSVLPSQLTLKIRSSIFMLGPLLARSRRAKVAYPGGVQYR